MKGEVMLKNVSSEGRILAKRILIMFAIGVALVGARIYFPGFFQCQSPECERTHRGEP